MKVKEIVLTDQTISGCAQIRDMITKLLLPLQIVKTIPITLSLQNRKYLDTLTSTIVEPACTKNSSKG